MSSDIRFTSLCPCADWFYTATGSQDEPIVFRVAAWALQDNGDVIGLVSASSATTNANVSRLVGPPPIGGRYVHESQLTPQQRERAALG
jgi:hypothetical protein